MNYIAGKDVYIINKNISSGECDRDLYMRLYSIAPIILPLNSHGTNYLQTGQSNSNKTCFMQSTIGNFNSPSFIMHTFTYVSAFCVSFNH